MTIEIPPNFAELPDEDKLAILNALKEQAKPLEKHKCPICNGEGKTIIPISPFYIATINIWEKDNLVRGEWKTRRRIRLEILKKFHEEFMENHKYDKELAIFIVDLNAFKKDNTLDQIAELMDE